MSFLLLTGDKANHLERVGPIGGISVSDEDPLYPRANLYDRDPKPFRFLTKGADRAITIDLNLLQNGNFETGSPGSTPPGWTPVPGSTFVLSTTQHNDGAMSAKIAAGNQGGRQTVWCRSGEAQNLSWALFGGGGSCQARLQVLNLHTQKFLTPGGAWQTSGIDVDTQTSAAWKTPGAPLNFTVEPYSTTGRDLVPLQVQGYQSNAGTTYYDSLALWPSTSVALVHGHRNFGGLTVELRRDTAAFAGAGTLESTMTAQPVSFYASLGTVRTDRYWRLKLVGTVGGGFDADDDLGGASAIAELFLGQRTTLTRPPNYPIVRRLRDDQSRVRVGNLVRRYRRGDTPVLGYSLDFRYLAAAEQAQAEELILRSGMGLHPVCFVPDDADPSISIFGQLFADQTPEWAVSQAGLNPRDSGLEIWRMPTPLWVG